ncbi:hypothetical protein RJ639_001888 [Escallonia herrerae]|uniref:Uncharacterized protein n=1 Tax=Escallonia herrerae TaxID=1293975 RepID=A0AA88XGI2_9ASTE|nr:hypothetical protein RJ639_001888 [Escallonia herrerae]
MATSETIPESRPIHPNVQHSSGTVYVMPYVAPAHGFVGLGERPKKFNGKDFKRWQQKMLFYLNTLNLARFLQEDASDLGENPDRQTVAAVDAWKHLDFSCKNYILNGLDNALYNMVDSKIVNNQVQEFQLILHDIHAEGMVLGESLQVAALIEKLPHTWKDFKNYLKHKRKEMKLEDLIVRLRIEDDNRQSEKKASNYHQEAKANVVEQVFYLSNLAFGQVSYFEMAKVQDRVDHLLAFFEKLELLTPRLHLTCGTVSANPWIPSSAPGPDPIICISVGVLEV